MKKLGIFGKLLYWVNLLAALMLAVSFVLPYLPPKSFPVLSLLNLTVSPLILVNIMFAFFWVFYLDKKMMISISVLVITYFYFDPFLEFSTQGKPADFDHTLNVTTYNVRLFNAYEEKSSTNIASVISELIETQNPDILCIQEYYREHDADFSSFPYQYIHFKGKRKLGHAIFSKYPLLNSSAFDFDDTYNNTLFSDVIIGKDTIRLYNLHLQSFGILPTVDYLNVGNKERIRKRVSKAFVDQESQIVGILQHKEQSPYPVIICGDFNNTSFSYVYRKLKKGMNDSFLDRGNGLGTTFKFLAYPFRIDYILSSSPFETISFETVKTTFSDHYPVSASLGW